MPGGVIVSRNISLLQNHILYFLKSSFVKDRNKHIYKYDGSFRYIKSLFWNGLVFTRSLTIAHTVRICACTTWNKSYCEERQLGNWENKLGKVFVVIVIIRGRATIMPKICRVYFNILYYYFIILVYSDRPRIFLGKKAIPITTLHNLVVV